MSELSRLMERGSRIEGGCLIWTGCLVRGYGHVRSGGKVVKVHRRVYELTHDVVLVPSVKVLHSCDTPPCYEPAHLRAGTQANNAQDRRERGRASRRGNPKTTPEQRSDIAARYRSGESPALIAAAFGLNRNQPARIARVS